MDPITVELLLSLAGGAAGNLGAQTWTSLTELVRRPFQRGELPADTVALLDDLSSHPTDPGRAQTLIDALAARSALDPAFSADLRAWAEQASQIQLEHSVHNTVSGGVQGTVVQGRDFAAINFATSMPMTPPHPRVAASDETSDLDETSGS